MRRDVTRKARWDKDPWSRSRAGTETRVKCFASRGERTFSVASGVQLPSPKMQGQPQGAVELRSTGQPRRLPLHDYLFNMAVVFADFIASSKGISFPSSFTQWTSKAASEVRKTMQGAVPLQVARCT